MSGDPVCPDVAGRDLCGGGALPLPDVRGAGGEPGHGPVPPVRADPQAARPVATGHRTLSDRAISLVGGDRQEAYGPPVEHAEKVAGVWRAMFGWDVDAHRFTLAMAALKLVREANRPKEDSRVDAVGWLEIADMIVEGR